MEKRRDRPKSDSSIVERTSTIPLPMRKRTATTSPLSVREGTAITTAPLPVREGTATTMALLPVREGTATSSAPLPVHEVTATMIPQPRDEVFTRRLMNQAVHRALQKKRRKNRKYTDGMYVPSYSHQCIQET